MRQFAAFAALAILAASFIFFSGCTEVLFPYGVPAEGKPTPNTMNNPPPAPPATPPAQPPQANATAASNKTPAANSTNTGLGNATSNPSASMLNVTIRPINESDFNMSAENKTSKPPKTAKNNSAYPIEIYYFDTGFGDATLIREGGFSMLLDTGTAGNADALLSNLSALGVRKLDIVALTGWDAGKVGGLEKLVSGFPIGAIWHNNATPDDNLSQNALSQIEKSQIPVQLPENGKTFQYGDTSFEFINPQAQRSTGNPNLNSLVFNLRRGKFCAFFGGDLEQETEPLILSSLSQCQLMKMPNRGAGRSTPSLLLDKIDPQDAIISVGPNNEGLPTNPTLERLRLHGIKVWRTDVDGSIQATANASGSFYMNSTYDAAKIGAAYLVDFPE